MDEPKSFHDVARPGNTPQSPTSRPIIVGREPIMQDPMMKGEAQPPKPTLPDHKDEPTMTPPTMTSAPSAETPASTPAETPPESEVSTALNSSIPSAAAKEAKTAEDKQLQDASAKVQDLIESKTYAVPVGHLQRKRTMRIVLIVGAVVLVVGAGVAYFIASSM